MPRGWDLTFRTAYEDKKASISIHERAKCAAVKLDHNIFDNKNVPDGCKIFIIFHEMGHLIHGPDEEGCDEFAFWHALRAGVTPFLCYVAIRHYMPAYYASRIERLGMLLKRNPQFKNAV